MVEIERKEAIRRMRNAILAAPTIESAEHAEAALNALLDYLPQVEFTSTDNPNYDIKGSSLYQELKSWGK